MIETSEDAVEYIEKVKRTLFYLAELSADAGLNRHAAVFHAITAAFMSAPEEREIFEEIIFEYNTEALKRHMQNYEPKL